MSTEKPIALIYGPSLERTVGGYSWVKLNLYRALEEKYRPISVYAKHASQAMSMPQMVKCAEDREGKVDIEESCIHSAAQWVELLNITRPAVVIITGDPDKVFFTVSDKDQPHALIYYFLSEAPTLPRYWAMGYKDNRKQYFDFQQVTRHVDCVIPGSHITEHALKEDLKIEEENLNPDVITPPLWRWDVTRERSFNYRRILGLDPGNRIFFTVAANNARKRLDQLLVYFSWYIRKRGKPCCDRLLIKTVVDQENGYDIPGICDRLQLTGFVYVEENHGSEVLNNVFSAGDIFISLPSAEGYGLPFHEALLHGKEAIHTDVGEPFQTSQNLKGQSVTVLETDRAPYFHTGTNQMWFNLPYEPKEQTYGKSGQYTIEEVTNTHLEFRKLILDIADREVAKKAAKVTLQNE